MLIYRARHVVNKSRACNWDTFSNPEASHGSIKLTEDIKEANYTGNTIPAGLLKFDHPTLLVSLSLSLSVV